MNDNSTEENVGAEQDTNTPDRYFATLVDFVDEYLTFLYPKNVTTRQGLTWCREWWKHPAATVRFHALWMAWEDARVNGGDAGLAAWLVNYADPIMAVVFTEDGPFEGCSVERGHVGDRPNPEDKLPTVPAPFGLFGLAQE